MSTTTNLHCTHCGEPVDTTDAITARFTTGPALPFCCYGCKNVYELIQNEGLSEFYSIRTHSLKPPVALSNATLDELRIYDMAEIQKDFAKATDTRCQTTLLIEDITCAACIWLIERRINSLSGVDSFTINHSSLRATLVWDDAVVRLSDILEQIFALGYPARPYKINDAERHFEQARRESLLRLAIAGLGMMQNMMFAIPLYMGLAGGITGQFEYLFRLISLLVATPVVFYSARPFFSAAVRDIKARSLTMDVPVATAIGLAYSASLWTTLTHGAEVYFDSVAMFTFFLLLGRHLEMQARLKANASINALHTLIPLSAIKLEGEQEKVTPLSRIRADDLLLIKPGAVIPADGKITRGRTSIDEAALTGEFMPVPRAEGEFVAAGTTNIENPICIRVEAIGQGTKIDAIMQLLEQAQREKPAIAQLANKLSGYFILRIMLICVLVYTVWHFIDPQRAFDITLSVLVVTCPCALSLATPAALTAATTWLRMRGFLVTRGHVMEALAQTKHLVFDKTGTLTEGQIQIQEIRTFTGNPVQAQFIAAALERHSEHPIARAFTGFNSPLHATNLTNHVGLGLEGSVENQCYRLGTPSFIEVWHPGALPPELSQDQWIALATPHQLIAAFRLADTLRASAISAITALKQQGLQISLLSGDQSKAATATAKALGIEQCISGASPQTKLETLKAMFAQDPHIAMVGDGINDVPALAGAPLSIAMGSANELAKLKADAILLSGNLDTLCAALKMGKKTRTIIRQNLAWAIGYNLTALPLAILGMIPPWAAALGMSASSLVVVLNSLRLSRESQ